MDKHGNKEHLRLSKEVFTTEWLFLVTSCLSIYLEVVQQQVIALSLFNAQINLTIDFVPLKF